MDPCASSTINLDPANVLLGTAPIATYLVAQSALDTTWPQSQVISTALSACGSLVYELWDVTSGSEVDPTIENIMVADFSTATHKVTAFTSDLTKARAYDLRYKVYLANYTSVVLNGDF